jgi:hypothetical protein
MVPKKMHKEHNICNCKTDYLLVYSSQENVLFLFVNTVYQVIYSGLISFTNKQLVSMLIAVNCSHHHLSKVWR